MTLALHGTKKSGHVHRVEAMLRLLDLPFDFVDASPEVRRTPAFKALNPLGEIPVLVDGDLVLADSNAILVYLARRHGAGTTWLPDEPAAAARVQRWLSIAAGELRFGPALARLITLWGRPGDVTRAREIAGGLLAFMNDHLAGRSFLAEEHPTIADVACWAYVAHAPEGRISLAPYPAVRAWIERVAALPRFPRMAVSELPPEEGPRS